MATTLITLFNNVNVPSQGNSLPSAAVDLTGYKEYRLVLRLDGVAGTKFTINELYGPAGSIAQLNVDIATGTIGTSGNLNYRGKFDIYGPKSFTVRVFNNGTNSFKLNGSLYAVD